ncbi:MAG: hypothetical protein M3N97_15685 [Pseudomonadota bacterium]|nr:hypothetical protein [Pseudomonadota bacterium]
MVDPKKKQAVSIRLGASDIRNIKRAAKRLGVRDSDIMRFAIKSTLNRISPLCDPAIRGRNLVPVLVESGEQLIRYFELDAYRLESIINENAGAGCAVESDDIALLAMSGLREEYLAMRLKDGRGVPETSVQERSLRRYLYDKYVYKAAEPPPAATSTDPQITAQRAAGEGGADGHGGNEALFAAHSHNALQIPGAVSP